jgi:hypothetical protein
VKRDLDLVLKDHTGKPFSDSMTLGKAIAQALTIQLADDARQSVDERMKLFRMLQRVAAGGVAEFTTDELAMVKRRAVASGFTLAGFGSLADALDLDHAEAA